MLEGIKILAERIVDLPELYDSQPRVKEVRLTDLEFSTEQQVKQLIKIVYENEHDIFTEEEINHIKGAERECRRKVFNAWLLGIVADHHVYLPETREQRKERIEVEQEERNWRIEKEKKDREFRREQQLIQEQMMQRVRHEEMLRGGTGVPKNSFMGVPKNSLTGGY
jgi:hypothetical protein